MKLTITVDGHESYLVLKDSWSRRDLREWDKATDHTNVWTAEEMAFGIAPSRAPGVERR